jgi:hypothetical protein
MGSKHRARLADRRLRKARPSAAGLSPPALRLGDRPAAPCRPGIQENKHRADAQAMHGLSPLAGGKGSHGAWRWFSGGMGPPPPGHTTEHICAHEKPSSQPPRNSKAPPCCALTVCPLLPLACAYWHGPPQLAVKPRPKPNPLRVWP